MFRIRASDLTRIISGTLVTIVVGFTVAFSYLLFQLSSEINSASSFFGSAGGLMYISVEGLFLALVIFAAFAVVRRKA
jgi:hypothetical protein